MKSSPATEQDVAFFQENGFAIFCDFFTKEEIRGLRDAMDETVERKRERILGDKGSPGDNYMKVFNQLVNLWVDVPAIKPYTFHPALAETARRLTQCRHVRLYHDHALIKPGGETSRETNWHQDAPYWPMEPVGALSAWIAVDDVTVENGCMQFIPQSHKYGRLEPIALGVDGESIVQKMKDKGKPVKDPVVVEMPAGGVTFHHGCNFHYATPNRADKPRRAFAIIYIPDFTIWTGRGDAGGAAGEMTEGQPWNHPLHPILAGEP